MSRVPKRSNSMVRGRWIQRQLRERVSCRCPTKAKACMKVTAYTCPLCQQHPHSPQAAWALLQFFMTSVKALESLIHDVQLSQATLLRLSSMLCCTGFLGPGKFRNWPHTGWPLGEGQYWLEPQGMGWTPLVIQRREWAGTPGKRRPTGTPGKQ